VLDRLFTCLTAWLAPILCFTAEEAWWARGTGPEESVHLRPFPEVPQSWRDDDLAAKWAKLREVRRVVTGALEVERAEKRIGSSLQAHPVVYVEPAELRAALDGVHMADIAITSDLTLVGQAPPAEAFRLPEVAGVGTVIEPAQGDKCQRCWKVLPEVGADSTVPQTCRRCADAVQALSEAVD
jgi:isoleucyl-tRNA synthetase